MTYTDVTLIITAVAFCALVVALIPTIVAIKRTADSVSILHRVVYQELRPTLRELTATLTDIKILSVKMAEHTSDVACFMTVLGITGTCLHSINRAVGIATPVLHWSAAWITGARVTAEYIGKRFFTKKGGNDHV